MDKTAKEQLLIIKERIKQLNALLNVVDDSKKQNILNLIKLNEGDLKNCKRYLVKAS